MLVVKKFLPSFVINRARGFNKDKAEQINKNIAPYLVDKSFVANFKGDVVLELGSGYGDTITHLASSNPQKLYIACEVYPKAQQAICQKASDANLTNIRLFKEDARLLLDQLDDASLSGILVLFPDPWPKKKHFKRRIINLQSLQLFAKKLKTGGELFIATDHECYKGWICEVILNQNLFTWQADTPWHFTHPPTWWQPTKFELKAKAEGRSSAYFKLIKSKL